VKTLLSPSGSFVGAPAQEGWLRARPFVVAALIAVALLPAAGSVDWSEAAVAFALAAVCILSVLCIPGVRRRATPDVRAIAALIVLGILRDSVGGALGGYGSLVMLPVLWVALYGNNAQLLRVLFAVVAFQLGPLIFIGSPHYPPSGWRSGPLLLIACALVGLIVQELLGRERERAAEHAGLLAAIGDGVIVTDARGHVMEVNEALCRITGYEAHEIVGQTAPLPSWPSDDHEELMRSHAEAITAGGGAIEARLERKDGREIFVQIALAVSTTLERRTVVATVKDVTEQVDLREQLRTERDRSQAIVESTHEGFGLTRHGQIIEVNSALCRITGFTREQLVGARPPYPFWPPEHQHEISEVLTHIGLDRGGSFEATFMRADGVRFNAEVTAAPVAGADGVPGSFVNSVRDITERKRAEQAARDRSEQLAELASITRAVAHAEPADARRVVCEMAMRVGEASAATLWEADDEWVLHNTCMLGGRPPDFTLGPDAVQSGARRAFDTHQALFASDVSATPVMDPRMRELTDCGSAHFQPIFDGDRAIGVLALVWTETMAELGDRRSHLVALLAHEASVAIGKAAAHEQLEQMAHTDVLTGLANRRALEDQFPRAIATAQRCGHPLSLAMIDLDHFKAFNDLHGHPRGDRLLREASEAWLQRLRATDVLARWGGEEFCLLLPDCSADCATEILEDLRALTPEGQSFSAGVIAWNQALSDLELVERADAALYEAKRRGRARTVVAGDEIEDAAA